MRLVRPRYVRLVATGGRLEQRHRKSANMARVVSAVETKTELKDDAVYDVNIAAVRAPFRDGKTRNCKAGK